MSNEGWPTWVTWASATTATNVTPIYPAGITVHSPPSPRKETALDWLEREIAETCEVAAA
jgi:hypothetical protein